MMMMTALIRKKSYEDEAEYKHLRDINEIGLLY